MSFATDIARFKAQFEGRLREIHNQAADEVYRSVVEGSPITGAPGQPVDTGNLKGSWQNQILGPLTRAITTNVVYAQDIEDGVRHGVVAGVGADDATDAIKAPDAPLTLRSQVGGFHSVKLTRAGWQGIVDHVIAGSVP